MKATVLWHMPPHTKNLWQCNGSLTANSWIWTDDSTCTIYIRRYGSKYYLNVEGQQHITSENGGLGHVARMGERRGVYRVLVGKPEGKRSLGRPRRIWEDNIKMDLQEVGCGDMNWIELAYLPTSGFSLFQHRSTIRYPWLRISKSSETRNFCVTSLIVQASSVSCVSALLSIIHLRCLPMFFFFLYFVNFGFKWALNTSI